ncbi:MAG: TonB-dependent receptor family protein [Hyphomonadaceae bacterium]
MSTITAAALMGGALGLALAAPAFAETGAAPIGELVVTANARALNEHPRGQTASVIERSQFEHMPAVNIGDILVTQPGVTFAFGNGPRDVAISVRGSSARQTFGVRNIQVFEDGFPVTQPDGLSRTDLTDPHAYGRIDVVRGPSSALFGNYATGGAISFFTRAGSTLNGAELGFDAGEDRYRNLYLALGGGGPGRDQALFFSDVSGDGFTAHTGYSTTTINARGAYALTPRDRLVLKFINNDLDADLSLRLSLAQFEVNPFQAGCAALAAAGCVSASVFANGVNGARQAISAEQGGLRRADRRTIGAVRWEHDVSPETVWRTQAVVDYRDIDQPTGASAAVGDFPSLNVMSDIAHRGRFLGWEAIYDLSIFANQENIRSKSYNVSPLGGGALGALTQTIYGHHTNRGVRARMEVTLDPRVTAIFGLGYERTRLRAVQTAFTYPVIGAPTRAALSVDRVLENVAPEIAMTYSPSEALRLHARLAAGYGTPQVTNLFITPAGVPGNNTQLEAQTNVGLDLGGEWSVSPALSLSLTGFYEIFRNELVSQSPGAGLQNYTFNAPKSVHRGIEAALTWRPWLKSLPGAQINLSYLLNDQIYDAYRERLSAGAFSSLFDRSGNRIPGVPRQFLNGRLSYDQQGGAFAGLGGFLEATFRDDAYVDNANLLKAPGYTLINLNLHYDPPAGPLARARFFVAVQNVADETYVSSASNIANSISAVDGAANGSAALRTATGAVYAGAPRTLLGGVRVRF